MNLVCGREDANREHKTRNGHTEGRVKIRLGNNDLLLKTKPASTLNFIQLCYHRGSQANKHFLTLLAS